MNDISCQNANNAHSIKIANKKTNDDKNLKMNEDDVLFFQKNINKNWNNKFLKKDENKNDTISSLFSKSNKSICKELNIKHQEHADMCKPNTKNKLEFGKNFLKKTTLNYASFNERNLSNNTYNNVDSNAISVINNFNQGLQNEHLQHQHVSSNNHYSSQQINDRIIDHIMVSVGSLDENRTVTIKLSPQLLHETEINFVKTGTELNIQFVSQNKDSLNFLQHNQVDLLAKLHQEIKEFKTISVNIQEHTTNTDQQNQNKHSRNRFEYEMIDDDNIS